MRLLGGVAVRLRSAGLPVALQREYKDLDFATAIAAATDSHPVLLPAVKAAFEELVTHGLGDFDIAVTRRFISQR